MRLAMLTLLALVGLPCAAASAATFQSPSGNIGCGIDKQGVRCDIAKRDWTPPKPRSCPLDWGNGLIVAHKGRAAFTCAGDTVLGQGRHLPYGTSIRRGRFRCVSRTSGIRCVNRRNGHGFALSRQHARRF